MAEPKEMVGTAIARAQEDLAEALTELEKIPAFDSGSVAFIAHSLNNYLTVIGGTVDLIMLHLGNHSDAQLRIWLEGLRHASDLMTRTASQLVNEAAPDGVQLRLELIDLPRLVRRACTYYQRVAEAKTIRILVAPDVGVPRVQTDRVVVAAVLDNLMSNAIKYSPAGSQIRVLVWNDAGWVVCDVRDEGPGLSPADQARLFQRGARLTPQPTGGEPSAGYGLAVAKELVEKLGGTIACESVLGEGSCFSFRLPTARAPVSGP
jgi:signal transduction histidine kinase